MVAGSGEAVPPQSCERRPFNAETPNSQASSKGAVSSPLHSPYNEEEDGEEDPPEEVAGGSGSSRPPSEEVAGGSSSSRPPSEEVAGGSSRGQSGIAGGGSRIPGGSRLPVQQEVDDYFARIQARSQQRQSQQAWSVPPRQMPPPLLQEALHVCTLQIKFWVLLEDDLGPFEARAFRRLRRGHMAG